MPFELAFHPKTLREWHKLTAGIRDQFKKLVGLLIKSRNPAYELRASGFRVAYEVRNQELLVLVVAVDKRERNAAFKMLSSAEALPPWISPVPLRSTSYARRTRRCLHQVRIFRADWVLTAVIF